MPAPKPLSPRAAAFVREIFEQENARQRAIQKAVAASAATSPAHPVTKASKAKSDQVAVYDAEGNLVGVTDPDAITPVATAQTPEKPKTAPAADPAQAPQPTAKAMSAGARGHQLGGTTPRGGVPITDAQTAAEDEVVTKTRAGDYQGAARILKARLAQSHDARDIAAGTRGLEALAAAEFARMRNGRPGC